MPPVAQGGDAWARDFDEAMRLLEDLGPLLEERNELIRSRQDPSRVVATARRKLTMLTTKADRLEALLKAPQQPSSPTAKDLRRREDLLLGLRYKAKEMAAVLSSGQQSNRASLLGGGSAASTSYAPVETPQTASLDSKGLVALQHQVIREQDDEILELENTVASTKNIALTINGELDLHKRLLDDLDGDLQSTGARMKVARRKLTIFSREADKTCNMCLVMLLATGLVLVALFVYAVLKIIY